MAAEIEKLKQQILGQGVTSKWKGEGHGSAEKNAEDMAKILASIGISDIKQFGAIDTYTPVEVYEGTYKGQTVRQAGDRYYFRDSGEEIQYLTPEQVKEVVPVQYGYREDTGDGSTGWNLVDPSTVVVKNGVPQAVTGQQYGNKETGQVVPTTYGARQQGNAWGGTFSGEGNTAYRVHFTPDGTPVFFTTEASSSDLGSIAPLLAFASVIPSPLQPFAAAANAAIALKQGNVLPALAAMAGIPGVANTVGSGLASAVQTANQVNNFVNAAETGDVLGMATAGANLTGTGGVQIGDTGYNVADAVKAANIVNAASQGNVVPLIGTLARSGLSTGPNPRDFEAGSFDPIYGRFDPATYGAVDLTSPTYTPTTNYSIQANYDLFPDLKPVSEGMGAQGVRAPALPDVYNPDGSINYSLFSPTPGGGDPALRMPTTPNLDYMGGGQGITVPVSGGTMTGAGFIPAGYSPSLGDPASPINKPIPGGPKTGERPTFSTGPSSGESSGGPSGGSSTDVAVMQGSPAGDAGQAGSGGLDILSLMGLMSLMDEPQQGEPIQAPLADVKSFEEMGYGDIFGPKLQFSDGGSTDDLIKILRG